MNHSDEMAPAVASILEAARERAARDRTGTRHSTQGRVSVDGRSLRAAIERADSDGRVPVIAEVKPTSPTTDSERSDDPVALAEAMVAGGAAALSVLTEPDHFGGSPETLARVREAVDVPVLRKDFLLRERQLDAVAADAVLLIARFLDEPDTDDLDELIDAARERGMEVLVETHTREEVELALDAGADVIGVNNRDLAALSVDLSTFERVAPAIDSIVSEQSDARDTSGTGEVTLVAESGIETPTDASRMRAAGADAVLVGSAIMGGPVRETTRALTDAESESDRSAATVADSRGIDR